MIRRRSKRPSVKRRRFDEEDEKPERTKAGREPVDEVEAMGHRQAELLALKSFNRWLDDSEVDAEEQGKESANERGPRRQSDRIRLGNIKPAPPSLSDNESRLRADGEPDARAPGSALLGTTAETTPDGDVRRRDTTEPPAESAVGASSSGRSLVKARVFVKGLRKRGQVVYRLRLQAKNFPVTEEGLPLGEISYSEHRGPLMRSTLALRRAKRIPGGNPLDVRPSPFSSSRG